VIAVARPVERHERARVSERQGPDRHGVHDAEDRAVDADAESQAQNRQGREARLRGEIAEGVSEVLNECVHVPSGSSAPLAQLQYSTSKRAAGSTEPRPASTAPN